MTAADLLRKQRAAAAFVERGWFVCLIGNERVPLRNCPQCSDRSPQYVPHASAADCPHPIGTCHGYQSASNDLAHVLGLIEQHPWANLAISTGSSRLVVIDLDANRKGAAIPEPYRALGGVYDGWDVFMTVLMRYHGDKPRWPNDTLSVLTPNGGLHLWWKLPPSVTVLSKNGQFGWLIDVKSRGAAVPAPGTKRGDGIYKRCGTILDPAPAPAWLIEHLRITGHIAQPAKPRPRRQSIPRPGRDRIGKERLGRICDQLARAEEGTRHETLVRAAYAAAHLVAAGMVDEAEAYTAVEEAGYDADRSTREIKSAWETALMKAGARR